MFRHAVKLTIPYQRLQYFPDLHTIPGAVISHIRAVMEYPSDLVPDIASATLYRCHAAIRAHLEVTSQGKELRHSAARAMHQAAQVMESLADLINAATQTLLLEHYELPAFSTLDRMAWRIRRLVNTGISQRVLARSTPEQQLTFSRLLQRDGTSPFTAFDRLKEAPKSATLTHLDEWLSRLLWLQSLGNMHPLLEGVRPAKITHLAQEECDKDFCAEPIQITRAQSISIYTQYFILVADGRPVGDT